MKKTRKKTYQKHSRKRFEERYTETSLTTEEVNKLIKNKHFIYAKRFSTSRSIIYILVPNSEEVIKAVINRETKQVITYLPLDYPFVIDPVIVEVKGKKYTIVLFPDMFKLTGNKDRSCEFYETDPIGGRLMAIDKDHTNSFDIVFGSAWTSFIDNFKKEEEK